MREEFDSPYPLTRLRMYPLDYIIALLIPIIPILWLFITTVWLIALAKSDNSVVDIMWGPGIFLVTLVGFMVSGVFTISSILMLLMICLWAARLSTMIAIRNSGKSEDRRYAGWRKSWGENAWWKSYLTVFVLQAVLILLIGLTPLAVFTTVNNITPGWLTGIGILVYAIGLAFETAGDLQLFRFKEQKRNKSKLMTTGLWAHTRHPNYFGEALVWLGIGLVALPAAGWWAAVAPVIVFILVRFISGVPKAEEHYRGRKDFAAYQKRTNTFFPLPTRK